MTSDAHPKIYLAGPDVFRPDAQRWGEQLVALCAQFGFVGLYPLDNTLPTNLSQDELRRWLREANRNLIRQSDIVMANLNFFRGAEPDSGTCYEIGFADALGKQIYGYLDGKGDLRSRIQTHAPRHWGGDGLDREGWQIEDFGYPVNLMLDFGDRIVVGQARDCLARIRADLGAGL